MNEALIVVIAAEAIIVLALCYLLFLEFQVSENATNKLYELVQSVAAKNGVRIKLEDKEQSIGYSRPGDGTIRWSDGTITDEGFNVLDPDTLEPIGGIFNG